MNKPKYRAFTQQPTRQQLHTLQQAVSRQFGQDSKQSAWIVNLAQGQAQVPVKSSNVYLFMQGTFYGRRNDDGSWGGGLQGTLGFGWQLEAVFSRGHN